MMEEKTESGMTPNVSGALCYLFGFITGIIFLFIEKDNKFVRYHAFQSIFLWAGLFIIGFVAGMVPIIGWVISLLLMPVGLILWIYCMVKAYNGSDFQLPMIGKIAKDQVEKAA
ncbi:DUF4870 domain-containing protein [Virgibacillus kimchii]